MIKQPTVHIRSSGNSVVGWCGDLARESISHDHYAEHVVPNATDCCAGIVARLCPTCRRAADETEADRLDRKATIEKRTLAG